MATGGSYRLGSSDFPAPLSTTWDEQGIGTGLDNFPINNSFRIHMWRWADFPGEFAELIFSAFDTQQRNRSAPTVIETDPYDGTGADEDYGTTEYNNVKIMSVTPRTRGLPHYESMEITFEVFVS